MGALRPVRIRQHGDFLSNRLKIDKRTCAAFGRLNRIVVDGLKGLG